MKSKLSEDFFSADSTTLKICGVTLESEANRLIEVGVKALGFNFWEKSKRFLEPNNRDWLKQLSGRVLRVGVFVNAEADVAKSLVTLDLIDVIQLHGDESAGEVDQFRLPGIPIVKACGVKEEGDLSAVTEYQVDGILLDTHAPSVYGGTGATFDWSLASKFKVLCPQMPFLLAGGITPLNAASAIEAVKPAVLDIASGAELSPGIKDFEKVRELLRICER